MDNQDVALAVILTAVFIGLLIGLNGPSVPGSVEIPGLDQLKGNPAEDKDSSNQESDGFRIGTAHEHAMFYVIHNGSEVGFLEPQYQLAAGYVHLENNNSHIVHKHAKGVTWNDFFQTIKMNITRNDTGYCADLKNISYCGEAAVNLNGDQANLDAEISQGDRMIIVLQNETEQVLEQYGKKQLPRRYKPQAERGRRL